MATVGEDDGAGQRLDNFLLRHYRDVPKSHLYRLIRSGQVRINGSRCHPDDPGSRTGCRKCGGAGRRGTAALAAGFVRR